MWDLQDSKGLYTIRRMVELMRDKGEGFLNWHWYKPGETGRMSEKIGFSKAFAPLDWWIGSGEYIEDVEREINLNPGPDQHHPLWQRQLHLCL